MGRSDPMRSRSTGRRHSNSAKQTERAKNMHPSISLMLRDPRFRNAVEYALAARGRHGDTMLAHISPAEAIALKRMGGAGTINPRTGLLQFWEDGGGGLGNAQGHAGAAGGEGGGGIGGSGGGGIRGGDSRADPGGYHGGTSDPSHGGSGNYGGGSNANGGNHGGIYGGDTRADPGMPGGGTSNPNFGGSGAATGDYRGHAYNPGVNVNLGRIAGGLLGSIFGPLGSAAGGLLGGALTGDTNIGGGWSPGSGGPTATADGNGVFGGGWGGGGPGNAGNNVGQNGGGQHNAPGMGNTGNPGGAGGGGAPGTGPAPGTQPAGLPPAVNPALAGLYYGGYGADPFAGRFGVNPGLAPYLIAAGQPSAMGYLSGMWR
jgi:hypothetical protein